MIQTTMRLLVIDQDIPGDDFLNRALNPNRYHIKQVGSGEEALKTSPRWNPDVIIINLLQPSSNGWELCQVIRKRMKAPILVLAAVSDPNLIAHWLDAGADDYLTKPFSSDMLIAHLKKLTRRFAFKHS
jgi:DNA-binding response OmpR family regulator